MNVIVASFNFWCPIYLCSHLTLNVLFGLVKLFWQSKICKLDLITSHQYVLRLQISVHDIRSIQLQSSLNDLSINFHDHLLSSLLTWCFIKPVTQSGFCKICNKINCMIICSNVGVVSLYELDNIWVTNKLFKQLKLGFEVFFSNWII